MLPMHESESFEKRRRWSKKKSEEAIMMIMVDFVVRSGRCNEAVMNMRMAKTMCRMWNSS